MRGVVLTIGLGFLAACGAPSGSTLPATLEGLSFDTVASIGAARGADYESFGGIWDVAAAPNGRIALLDVDVVAVHVYDETGVHLGSITERGVDEGQLRSPTGIAWTGPDELLVWDPGSSWVSRFSVGADGPAFVDRHRAFAFGETGFCTEDGRVYISYFLDGQVIHEYGSDGAIVRSFSEVPEVAGMETLIVELQELALEELTPSKLLCVSDGLLEVSFFQSRIRFHDPDGNLLWSRDLADFSPVQAYSPDDMGVGLLHADGDGSHLLRSVVPWGPDHALLQYEMRVEGARPGGAPDPIESRLIRLDDGTEDGRTRDLPLILDTEASRAYQVRQRPFPQLLVFEVAAGD